jgi:hypothetical protein
MKKLSLLLAILFMVIYTGYAQTPPINDNCIDAVFMNCGDNLTNQTTYQGTSNGVGTSCSVGIGVWYAYVGNDEYITVTASPSIFIDLELAIASSTDCTTFTNIACVDGGENQGEPESYHFYATVGNTYYFYVGHWDGNGAMLTGDFDINVECCDAGMIISGDQDICEGEYGDIVLDGAQTTAPDGYVVGFDNTNTGGTGGPGTIFGISTDLSFFPVSFDNDLNGYLSGQGQPPLSGIWEIKLASLVNASNGIFCSVSNTVLFNFLDASDPTCPDLCLIPTNQALEMTTATTAFFSWDAVPGATLYQVKYRLKGTTSWITSGTTNTQKSISNLNDKKYYQYKIRAQCTDGSWSDYTSIELFYTSTCDVPTGIASIYLDETRMRIRWDNNPDEIKAKVRYREVGTPTWYTQNSGDGNNYIYINALTSEAIYQYRVRSNCDGNDWSAYSASYFHDLSGTGQRGMSELSSGISLYPNPSNEVLNLEFSTTNASEINITISDNLGKEVLSMNNTYQEGTQRETLDISRLTAGYYFVSVYSNDNVETLKFVKSK